MPCYHPITAWHSKDLNPSGKRSLVFNPSLALQRDAPISVSCKQCTGCRLCRSAQWAARSVHETQLYTQDGISNNCFITLTYNDQSLYARDVPWSLDVEDFQLFFKRLRREFGPGIRYLHCGEYGECCRTCGVKESEHKHSLDACTDYQLGRPHFHAIIFNLTFPDLVPCGIRNGYVYYTSQSLQDLWSCPDTGRPYGFVVVGNVSFQSAAYVARYALKKRNGEQHFDRYFDPQTVDQETGEFVLRRSEYATMSLKPGIGKDWLPLYWQDIYPHDYIDLGNFRIKPPEYYDNWLEKNHPWVYDEVKQTRLEKSMVYHEDYTQDRLYVREVVKLAQIQQLVRDL